MVELVGRVHQRAVIADLLFARTGDFRTLLLKGDSGIGKSALLQDAVETARARDTLIFRSVGVDTESTIDYSGLHQLVQPLMRAAQDCPVEWVNTLENLFASPDATPVSAFQLSNALIGVIDIVAERSAVLLVIDDIQWIDEASAKMLAFVARRITNPRVSVIVALRSGFQSPLERAGLPELLLLPLPEDEASELLARSVDELDASTLRQLLDESAGNPLALLELPKTLTMGQRAGDARWSEKWTLTERLETVFAARLSELSENSRWLLLLCALDRTERVATIKIAAQQSWWFPDLVAGNDLGLLRIDGDHVAFGHPLARSAVAQASSEADRRRAHAQLAEAVRDEPDAWAWHRSLASDDPDPEVADALETLARRALSNGDSRTALRAALRSVELSAPGDLRELRGARTSFLANVVGQSDVAKRTLPQRPAGYALRPQDGFLNETDGYIAASRAFWLVAQEADIEGASSLLFTALRGARNTTDSWVVELFDLLVLLCVRSSRVEHWEGLNAILAESSTEIPKSVAMTRDALGDPARTAHGFAERTSAFRLEVEGMEPWQLIWVASCAAYVDDLPAWRGEIRRVIQDEETGGSLASLLTALVLSSLDGLTSGSWASAREQASRGMEMAQRLDFKANVGDFLSILGILAARQGDFEVASEHIERLQQWALPLGYHQHRAWALYAEAQLVMAQHNYDEAFGLLIGISPVGSLAPYQPVALMAFMDTVIAAWKSGRHEEARKHLAEGHTVRLDAVSPRLAFHLLVCDAIVAADSEKSTLFEEALAHQDVSQWPFDEARARLHFGSWLLETGAAAASRPQLQTAARIFDRLGAVPWQQRAYAELARASDVGLPSPTGALAALTPQEARIAILAAEGRSNKEIAETLFLSPRTVASHLYKIFPKLGVTSRAGLHSKLNPGTRS